MAFNRVTYEVEGCQVVFPFAKVISRDEPMFAEDGTTQIATKYDLTVSGWITSDTVAGLQGLINQMRHTCNRRGGDLFVSWSEDGSTWKDIYRFTLDEDINFGPKPVGLEIVDFSGGRAALYRWSVTAVTHECFSSCSSDPSNPQTDVLSVTRLYRHSVDASGFTSRTVSGTVLIKSNSVLVGRPADLLRALPLPPLPSNFTRGPMEFTQSPDGRTLAFSCTDEEKMWLPEKPITEAEGSYSGMLQSEGAMGQYTLSGRFKAPANVSKRTILEKIGNLLFAKLPNGTYIWGPRQLTESIYANEVTFSFQWSAAGQADDVDVINLFHNFGGRPPGGDQSQPIGPYGGDGVNIDSGVLAGVPKVYDACNPSGLQVETPSSGGNTTTTVKITTPRNTPDDQGETTPGSMSTGHQNAPYTEFHERVSFDCDNHFVQIPSKVPNGRVIVQQTAVPTVVVTQAGYLSREGKYTDEPGPAEPLYAKDSDIAVVDQWTISPCSIVPLSVAGMYRFTISWRYVFLMKKSPPTVNSIAIVYPADVRTTDDPQAIPDMATEIVIQPV